MVSESHLNQLRYNKAYVCGHLVQAHVPFLHNMIAIYGHVPGFKQVNIKRSLHCYYIVFYIFI